MICMDHSGEGVPSCGGGLWVHCGIFGVLLLSLHPARVQRLKMLEHGGEWASSVVWLKLGLQGLPWQPSG